MTNLKTTLMAGAAVLAMGTGAAWANENKTYLDQEGTNNTSLVVQSGVNNEAGAVGLEMQQVNFQNDLNILQSGDNNDIGLEDVGVRQTSNRSNPGDIGNTLSITQSSGSNTVGSVDQTARGTNTSLGVNRATIVQGGVLGLNRVGTVVQDRGSSTSNLLDVTQTGTGDVLENVYQRGLAGGNQANSINVTMQGVAVGGFSAGNGREATLDGFANIAGVESSTLRQGFNNDRSRGNSMTLVITGFANDFGVTQDGVGNTIGTLEIGGIDNSVGIRQDGDRNTVSIAAVTGIGNEIGVEQFQNDNTASVSVAGSFNRFGVLQDGDGNMATVSIDGNNNGQPVFCGFLCFSLEQATYDNPAVTVAGTSGFEAGMIKQEGDFNDASLTVDGNDNLFGMLQDGDLNIATSTIDGNNNQVAIAQVGNENITVVTQIGNGNIMGVSQ